MSAKYTPYLEPKRLAPLSGVGPMLLKIIAIILFGRKFHFSFSGGLCNTTGILQQLLKSSKYLFSINSKALPCFVDHPAPKIS
mmetsp:Transcript_64236/g.73961  ORF Transcript_64236/g.73961 Transcript_64236/m.73961 type:complete len:83 (+) Transcript_64236:62-310(+)